MKKLNLKFLAIKTSDTFPPLLKALSITCVEDTRKPTANGLDLKSVDLCVNKTVLPVTAKD